MPQHSTAAGPYRVHSRIILLDHSVEEEPRGRQRTTWRHLGFEQLGVPPASARTVSDKYMTERFHR